MSSSFSSASKRLMKELADNAAHPNPALAHLAPVSEGDLMHWRAELLGPLHSPYAGCRWDLDIRVPDQYPQVPPEIRFVTSVCHPNVHAKTGEICLDLLRGTAWTPTYTLSSTLTQIQLLLTSPEPDSPLNVDAAAVLRNGDAVGYESLVRVWGVLYGGKTPTLR